MKDQKAWDAGPYGDATKAEGFPGARELGANQGPASRTQTRTPPLCVLLQREVAIPDLVSKPRNRLKERPRTRRTTL